MLLLDSLWEGLTVFDIAVKYNLNYDFVKSFFKSLLKNKLIGSEIVTSNYTRKKLYNMKLIYTAGTARGGTNFRTLILKNHSKNFCVHRSFNSTFSLL